MGCIEVNFDGLVGPTHNYAGLSRGNLASSANRGLVSSPRRAALQGLAKMRMLHERGFMQAVLPPQERPLVAWLRHLGFRGRSDAEVLAVAAGTEPEWLAAASSASAMWTANAATVTPAPDSKDGRLHLTPANLYAMPHRAIEAPFTAAVLRRIFRDAGRFYVHDPLAGGAALADEGAANHTRLAAAHGSPGLHFFVYGRAAARGSREGSPGHFPARQTLEASRAVARRHGIVEERTLYLQQHPDAVDAGVFHNDVICVGHLGTLFVHERAFSNGETAFGEIKRRFAEVAGERLRMVCVPESRVSLAEAVRSYLFNSQLLDLPGGGCLLVAPEECRRSDAVRGFLDECVADPDCPLKEVLFFDLRESMRNGGGPACLRLRVVLRAEDLAALGARVVVDGVILDELEAWVRRHYRETLMPADLADPALLEESRRALEELTGILRLGWIYAFQGVADAKPNRLREEAEAAD